MRAARGPEICHYQSRASDRLVTGDNRRGREPRKSLCGRRRGNVWSRTSPCSGETVTLEWQQNSQNFVIIDNE